MLLNLAHSSFVYLCVSVNITSQAPWRISDHLRYKDRSNTWYGRHTSSSSARWDKLEKIKSTTRPSDKLSPLDLVDIRPPPSVFPAFVMLGRSGPDGLSQHAARSLSWSPSHSVLEEMNKPGYHIGDCKRCAVTFRPMLY